MVDLKKSINSVLFDFDSIVDLKIGAVKIICKYYFKSDMVNKKFVGNDDDFFKMYHIYENENIIKSCFFDKASECYEDLYNELMEKYYDEIIRCAPKTTSVRFIRASKQAGGGNIIKCTVLCKSAIEKQYITEILPNTPVIMLPEDRELSNEDVDRYSRIVTSDWNDTITRYHNITGKDFLILDYRENFLPGSTINLNPALIIALGDLNSIHYCNAYENIEQPEG